MLINAMVLSKALKMIQASANVLGEAQNLMTLKLQKLMRNKITSTKINKAPSMKF